MFLKDFCVRGRIISARIIHTYPHWGERNTHRRSLRIAVLSRQLKRRELRTWLSSCASQWSSLLALSRNVCAAWRQSAACTPLFDCSLASLSPIHSPCLGGHYFIPISVLLSPFLMCLRCSFLPLTVVSAGCCLPATRVLEPSHTAVPVLFCGQVRRRCNYTGPAWSRSVSWLQAKGALAHIGLLRKETEGQFWYTFPRMSTII